MEDAVAAVVEVLGAEGQAIDIALETQEVWALSGASPLTEIAVFNDHFLLKPSFGERAFNASRQGEQETTRWKHPSKEQTEMNRLCNAHAAVAASFVGTMCRVGECEFCRHAE